MSMVKTNWRRPAILFFSWTLVGLVFAAVSYGVALSQNDPRFGIAAALKLNLVLFYLWGVFSLVIFRFSRRFRVDFRRLESKNLAVQLPAVVLFAFVHETLLLAILWSMRARGAGELVSIRGYYAMHFGYGFYINLIIASLIVIGAHALLYYDDFRAAEVQQSSLKAQLAQAQLKALKMQLHPHFLFNTLHSISSLVLEDPRRANSMIARLGDLLRLTLENSDQQLVSLKEELDFLRTYLEIEQVRFGDRLTVAFEMEPATLSAAVPHLILQPLVENAIQHAVAPRASNSHIDISARRQDHFLRLEVRDNGPGIPANDDVQDRQHVGLNNVRARLSQIYGRDFRFELANGREGGLSVVMEIPFRHQAS